MPYKEIIAVCSEIHTKHVNALCRQNVEYLNVKSSGSYSDQSFKELNETNDIVIYTTEQAQVV